MASSVHPALNIISRLERMWTDDKEVANDRALMMVIGLIIANVLDGTIENGVPVLPERPKPEKPVMKSAVELREAGPENPDVQSTGRIHDVADEAVAA